MTDFKKSTVYQIYPKSFADSKGNGTGDLRGIISKLDYLKELGIDYIWLTPFFLSPQKDNGYDVADYYQIDPSYGTMEDFENLVKEAAKREISLMLDMVFNHTSNRHEWFQKALAGDAKYKNYYIFKKGKGSGIPPTNWESKFGGNAWEYVEAFDEYYLHLFDVSQPDLNWDNEDVRKEMQEIVQFWMGKGVKGFRFDVVNLISKEAFEDDYEGDGRRFYTDGPNIHKYLRELNEKTFGKEKGIITVGEMSSTSMENCYQYAGEDGKEFSMVFSFHHLKVDFMGNEKWVLIPYDFAKLKQILFDWQTNMAKNHAWNAVFWCNHDQPRVVSRFGDTKKYWKESAKMLATVIHCLRGTPYIYQGEELGMTNAEFEDISQYRDVESLNHFQILQEKGLSEEQAYQILMAHSRDNSRTPMQWSEETQAGFTKGEPWIEVNPNYKKINAREQLDDPDSIFYYYKKLVSLRKDYEVIAYGDFEALDINNPSVMVYKRTYKGEVLVAASNFYGKEAEWDPGMDLGDYQCILGNYDGQGLMKSYDSQGLMKGYDSQVPEKVTVLRPYETRLYYKK